MKTRPSAPAPQPSIGGSLLWETWLRTCRAKPSRVVLIEATSGQEWTAEALTEHALRLSDKLADFAPGSQIAFRLPNGPEWMAFFLALQSRGLAAVPFDAALPKEGCQEVARLLRTHALNVEGELHHLEGGRRKPGCCCLKVTSGSEGTPKAVLCRADHLLADGRQVAKTMKIRPGDRNLAVIPLGHSYGLGNLVMPLIQQGTSIVTAPDYVPRQLVEWINRYEVTVLPLVPALLRVLAASTAPVSLGPVRTVISAGAILPPATALAFFTRYGMKVHNFYGSSETGGICFDRTGQASLSGRSVGKPLVGVSVVVKKGRITVTSPAVAARSGKWKLGDLGDWNKRGELVLLGRVGKEANIGGKKVHPLEIERILRSLPGVTDAAVWLAHMEGRDLLAAAIESHLTSRQVEEAWARQLPVWKWPKKYFIARELPRNARGKLEGAEIRKMLEKVSSSAPV